MDHGSTEATRVLVKVCGEPEISPAFLLSGSVEDRSVGLLRSFVATGNEQDFSALAQEIAPRLLRYCRALGSSRVDSEDIVQDVLYTVYSKVGTVREPGSFWPWLFRVTRNAQLQQLRRANRQLPSKNLDLYEETKMHAQGAPTAPVADFAGWIQVLDPGERDVMALRYVEDFEYQEIAKALAIPVGTVKSRLFNAKKKLSKQFKVRQAATVEQMSPIAGGQRGKK